MRIISGKARGRRLNTPQSQYTRPTTDRIRESLFAILGDVRGCVVLDGFAGTGALGLEAWSRGAARCMFVERDRKAAQLVRANLALLAVPDEEATLVQLPLDRALPRMTEAFDLIFLDPPYHTALLSEALALLAARPDLCTEDTLIIAEQEADEPELGDKVFEAEDVRTYGRTRLTFLRRAAQA